VLQAPKRAAALGNPFTRADQVRGKARQHVRDRPRHQSPHTPSDVSSHSSESSNYQAHLQKHKILADEQILFEDTKQQFKLKMGQKKLSILLRKEVEKLKAYMQLRKQEERYKKLKRENRMRSCKYKKSRLGGRHSYCQSYSFNEQVVRRQFCDHTELYDEVYDYVEDKVGLALDDFYTVRGALSGDVAGVKDNRQKVLSQLGKAGLGPRRRLRKEGSSFKGSRDGRR